MSLAVFVNPPQCTCCGHTPTGVQLSVMHNLAPLARELRAYDTLWHPVVTSAWQMRPLLQATAQALAERRQELAPRWNDHDCGTYVELEAFVQAYLCACLEHPNATIEVSR